MNAADIPFGMRLKEKAGWNQTEADWQRYLDLEPDGCFVAALDGEVVGTVTTCIFESVAWIAMMLVDSSYRGRGIGKVLMQRALEFLDQQAGGIVRLDATELGRPLYEKLGFTVEYTLHRHEGVLKPEKFSAEAEPMRAEHHRDMLTLDRAITQTDRRRLLLRLASEFPDTMRVVYREGRIKGYSGARPGSRALLIGPCLAMPGAGISLLEDARARYAGRPVFIDIPMCNPPAVQWAQDAGLKVQRPLYRMHRGPSPQEQGNLIWASSGPEMG